MAPAANPKQTSLRSSARPSHQAEEPRPLTTQRSLTERKGQALMTSGKAFCSDLLRVGLLREDHVRTSSSACECLVDIPTYGCPPPLSTTANLLRAMGQHDGAPSHWDQNCSDLQQAAGTNLR